MLRMKRHPRPSDPATAPCGGTVAPGGRFRRQPSPSNHRPADTASQAMIRGIALAAVTADLVAPPAGVLPPPPACPAPVVGHAPAVHQAHATLALDLDLGVPHPRGGLDLP